METPFSTFSAQELTNSLTALRNTQPDPSPAGFVPASSQIGRTLLVSKGCAGCHRGALALESPSIRYGLSEFAAALWNHPFLTGQQTPLSLEETRHLVGYLIATHFFEERDDPAQGQRVFKRKRCGACHDNPSTGAPVRAAMAGRMTS